MSFAAFLTKRILRSRMLSKTINEGMEAKVVLLLVLVQTYSRRDHDATRCSSSVHGSSLFSESLDRPHGGSGRRASAT